MYIHPQVTIRYWVALAITKVYPFLFLKNAAAFILLTLTFRSRHGSFSSASWHLAAGSRYHTPVRKHPATENRWCCVSEGRFRDMWCHCGVCVFLGNLRMSWFCRILTLCSGTKKKCVSFFSNFGGNSLCWMGISELGEAHYSWM